MTSSPAERASRQPARSAAAGPTAARITGDRVAARTPGLALLVLLVAFLLGVPGGRGGALAAPETAPPAWSALTPSQRQALRPLQPTWDSTDSQRKKKWIEVAERFPQMPPEERQRVQERMAAWAAMSPPERARARVQFQETRRIGAEERQARWQAYQSLPEGERKRLAQAAQSRATASNGAAANARAGGTAAAPGAASSSVGAKRNLVVATPGPAPRSVAPTVIQAKPGATTTTLTTPAKPPLHHQPGLPKIVATPAFVDPTTLLPRRGPQAAAMRTAASSDPAQQP